VRVSLALAVVVAGESRLAHEFPSVRSGRTDSLPSSRAIRILEDNLHVATLSASAEHLVLGQNLHQNNLARSRLY